jgi:hypothetical protein
MRQSCTENLNVFRGVLIKMPGNENISMREISNIMQCIKRAASSPKQGTKLYNNYTESELTYFTVVIL